MNPIITLVLSLMLGFGIFTLILIGTIRLVWHFIDVRFFVDVHVFHVGEQFLKVSTLNCRKLKRKSDSGLENYVLVKGKTELPFHKKTAFARQRDGKTVVMFEDIEGKLYPFLPTHDVVTNKDTDNITSIKTGLDWSKFTLERNDELVEDALRETWRKITDAGKKQGRKLGALNIILLVIAGAVVLGLVVWIMSKGAGLKLPGLP